MRKKKPPISKREIKPLTSLPIKSLPPRLDVTTLQKISNNIKSGKEKPEKGYKRVADHERGTGLKAHVYEDYWSYLVEYVVRGKSGRLQIALGKHPARSVEDARKIAQTVQRLAREGIDIKNDDHWLEACRIKTWRRGEAKAIKTSPDVPLEEPLDDATLYKLKSKARKSGERERLTRELIHIQAYPTGKVVFGIEYHIPGVPKRLHITIGDWPDMSVSEARYFSEVIRGLGMRGIDVQWGLHTRLFQELKRDGLDWRPVLSEPPAKK